MPDLKREVLDAVDRFAQNLAFTAPELYGMRIRQLRDEIETAFESTDESDEASDEGQESVRHIHADATGGASGSSG